MGTAVLNHQKQAVAIREFIWKRLPSLYIDVPALRPGSVGAYVLAIMAVGVATVLRVALDPFLVGAQFVTFFPAVVITTLISGFGAGFFCAVLSTAAADFFVLAPRFSFSFYVDDPAALADLLLFGPLASYCVILISRMRMAIEREQAKLTLCQLRLVTDNAPVAIIHCDAELRYKFFNRYHAERLKGRFGVTPEQVIGKRIADVWDNKLFAISEPYAREGLAGKTVEFEVELPYQAGEPQFMQCRLEPEWSEGKVVGLVSAATDITRLKTYEAALRKSKDRLQLCLDAAQLGWWQYDPRRRVISGDTRFNEIFDVIAEEVPIEEIKKLVHPDDVERFWADGEVWLNSVDRKPHADEYRIRRRDGAVRWVEAHWLAYFDDASRERGLADVVGTVQDITERKERQEREHLLMHEINHRAKNMLSVVDAIAHQTATRAPEDFIERFSERIQALAANQDLLIGNEWNGVEIEDLVCAQLALFADLVGSRIAVHGPKLRLKAVSAQAVGLALHELATNAGKYGALSTNTGRADISWAIDGNNFTMSWIEREGPLVSAPKRRGFGTIVMEAMAERSVDGAVELDYAPSGLTWRLICPAANALETP
jgi:PAS domain S-box-containing protein